MEKSKKPSNPVCYTPSSEPFRIYKIKHVTKLDIFALNDSHLLHIGHVYVVINSVSLWNYLFRGRDSPISYRDKKKD
jgi:hypothetical protein